MKALRALLRDRRRSQRGSVLSGVLIMTAFIAIISGALMTELSTNLLISRSLVNRVADQATENSAVELAVSQLQATQLNSPCPTLVPTALNGVTAAPTYLSCWPTVREATKDVAVAGSGAAFSVDGAHARASGLDDYVVGDSGGTVYDIPFGWSVPRWTLALGGQVTATPLVIAAPGSATRALDVIPVAGACGGPAYCLNIRQDAASSLAAPSQACVQPTSSAVASQPVASPTNPGFVYYGYGTKLEATDVSAVEGTTCDWESTVTVGAQPVVAGPVAFQCPKSCGGSSDYIYVVVGDSGSSHLLRYGYNGNLSFVSSLLLPWTQPQGITVSSTTVPATLAITFAGGGVALVQVATNGTASMGLTAAVGAGVADAPYWCRCPGGDQIGVAAENGGLYLFNAGLQPIATYLGGIEIDTSPQTDAAGNWYFGAQDGAIHEVQLSGGTATQVDSFGPMANVTSGVMVSGCPSGICVYAGAGGSVYLVPLDARRAMISACISTAPPACSGANPRLWASLEVGVAGNARTVHVEGWSYYSG